MNGLRYHDTGKVKIGINYQRDTRPELSRFEEKLQEAYLAKKYDPINAFFCNHPIIGSTLFIAGIALITGLFEAL